MSSIRTRGNELFSLPRHGVGFTELKGRALARALSSVNQYTMCPKALTLGFLYLAWYMNILCKYKKKNLIAMTTFVKK